MSKSAKQLTIGSVGRGRSVLGRGRATEDGLEGDARITGAGAVSFVGEDVDVGPGRAREVMRRQRATAQKAEQNGKAVWETRLGRL